jgi:peroxiredoxin
MGVRPAALEAGEVLAVVSLAGVPNDVTIGDPVVGSMQLVLFERGHWCPACRRHLHQVAEAHDQFGKRSVEVVAVTHERLDDLRHAALPDTYPYAIGVDPDLTLSGSLGLTAHDEHGKWTIRPAAIVVRPGGEIAFSYAGDDSIDRLSVPALLLAIDRLT